jgi:DNA-binding response OmpR family regulator
MHEVTLAGKKIDLTAVEFRLLSTLAKEPGRVFSRPSIVEAALGFDYQGFDRTIDVHIMNLRKKLEPDPKKPTYIKTVYGVGYKFNRDKES